LPNELTNHLGNVLSVVSDELTPNGEAQVLSAKDYYPFGMSMPSRTTEGGTYRYGFNGKETDPETGIQDYGMRWYLPNIARFPSVDPLTAEYPWYTPYQFAGNMPIWAIDLDGAEELVFSKQIEASVIGKELIKIVKHTKMFQDFEKLVAMQTKINVYIFAFKAEKYDTRFNTDGYSGGGDKGFTTMYDSYKDLTDQIERENKRSKEYDYRGGMKNIQTSEVERLFNDGKKVIIIRISENYLNPNDNAHDPNYLKNLKQQGKNS
jgi:RHS repeat-associated protein